MDHPYKWWREDEMTIEEDGEDADIHALIIKGMPEQVAKEYINTYELFLVHGVSAGDAKKKVTELFSPPRVTAELQRMPTINLAAGATYDLRADAKGRSWDFLKQADRAKARKEIREQKPFMVIGSPPCTAFCTLNQGLNKHKGSPEERKRKMTEATTLLHFALEIYELQVRAGRHFLHEHPQGASSWRDARMEKMMKHPSVETVVAHLCQFGMKTKGANGDWQPAKKATRFCECWARSARGTTCTATS